MWGQWGKVRIHTDAWVSWQLITLFFVSVSRQIRIVSGNWGLIPSFIFLSFTHFRSISSRGRDDTRVPLAVYNKRGDTHYILDKRQDEKQTFSYHWASVYCQVIACFNNDRRLFSNRCFLPPGLSFPSLRSGSHDLIIPFMELANRFSQWFAEYLHHCTLYLQAAASPGAYLWLGLCAQLVALHSKCARNTRARSQGAQHMRGHDLTSGVFLSSQETFGGSGHTHEKFLILFVLCILLVWRAP